jgi:hypothetical protein
MKKVYMRSPYGEVFATSNPEYHKDCENLGGGDKGYSARQAYAREKLREFIKPGDTVYSLVRSVSSSGMSRTISFYVALIDGTGRPYMRNIDALMSDACGIREAKGPGLVFGGCGMDMAFSGVYSLGRALFPEGFGEAGKTPDAKPVKRPPNKAVAARYVKKGIVFRGRNGDASGWDCDGGYALKKESL